MLKFAQSLLDFLGKSEFFDILKLLGKQNAQTIDRSLATDAATRAGVKNMLLGRIMKIGECLRLISELINVRSGSIIATQDEEFMRQAIEMDPNFAVADSYLAFIQTDFSPEFSPYTDLTEAEKTLELAKANSGRVTDQERLMIQLAEAGIHRDRSEAAAAARELISRGVPDKFAYLTIMLERWHHRDFQGAVQTMEEGLEADPTEGNHHNMLAYSYGYLHDFAKAISAVKKYIAVSPDAANGHDTACLKTDRTGETPPRVISLIPISVRVDIRRLRLSCEKPSRCLMNITRHSTKSSATFGWESPS